MSSWRGTCPRRTVPSRGRPVRRLPPVRGNGWRAPAGSRRPARSEGGRWPCLPRRQGGRLRRSPRRRRACSGSGRRARESPGRPSRSRSRGRARPCWSGRCRRTTRHRRLPSGRALSRPSSLSAISLSSRSNRSAQLDQERDCQVAPVVLDQVEIARRNPEFGCQGGLAQALLPAQAADASAELGEHRVSGFPG